VQWRQAIIGSICVALALAGAGFIAGARPRVPPPPPLPPPATAAAPERAAAPRPDPISRVRPTWVIIPSIGISAPWSQKDSIPLEP
jgi:hypothetical protein